MKRVPISAILIVAISAMSVQAADASVGEHSLAVYAAMFTLDGEYVGLQFSIYNLSPYHGGPARILCQEDLGGLPWPIVGTGTYWEEELPFVGTQFFAYLPLSYGGERILYGYSPWESLYAFGIGFESNSEETYFFMFAGTLGPMTPLFPPKAD